MSAPSGTLLKESVCLSISATQLSAYCTVTVSCPPSSFSCVIPFSVSPPTPLLSTTLVRLRCPEPSVQETSCILIPCRHLRSPVTWPEATGAIYPLGPNTISTPMLSSARGYGVRQLSLQSVPSARVAPVVGVPPVCPFIMHLDLPFLFESYSFLLVPFPLSPTASFQPASQLFARALVCNPSASLNWKFRVRKVSLLSVDRTR